MDKEARESRSEMRVAVISAMTFGSLAGLLAGLSTEPRPRELQAHLDRAEELRVRITREGAVQPGRNPQRGSTGIDPSSIRTDRLSAGTKRDLLGFWRRQKRLKPKFQAYWNKQGRGMVDGTILGGVAGTTVAMTALAAHDLRRRRKGRGKKRKKK